MKIQMDELIRRMSVAREFALLGEYDDALYHMTQVADDVSRARLHMFDTSSSSGGGGGGMRNVLSHKNHHHHHHGSGSAAAVDVVLKTKWGKCHRQILEVCVYASFLVRAEKCYDYFDNNDD